MLFYNISKQNEKFNPKESYYLILITRNVWMFPERYKTISSLFILIHPDLFLPGILHQNFARNIDSRKTVEYEDQLFLGLISKDQ
jgi:hypothetical protein